MSSSVSSSLFCVFTLFFICSCYLIGAQQPYVGKTTSDCGNQHNSSSGLGYFCNGGNRSCQTYVTFRAIPKYNTVSAISTLLGADPSQVSLINSVPETTTFDTNKLVIVPVNCSCSGEFYQSNTSYVVNEGDQYSLIANELFQGLATCQAIMNQPGNPIPTGLIPGQRISVPLRCACPTKNQSDSVVNYLISYLIGKGESPQPISQRFEIDEDLLRRANSLSQQDIIFPNTTLLVPLDKPPSSSQTVEPPTPPPSPPVTPPTTTSPSKSSKKTWVYALIGALGGTAFLLVLGAIIYCRVFRKSKKKLEPALLPKSFEANEKAVDKKIEESQDFLDSLSDIAQSIKVYKFEELQLATNYFSNSNLVKGSVYKGTIKGDFAAIKKVDGDISKEINVMQKINHSNLIRLSGICFNEGFWYLVYEYAANGPLSSWIHHKRKDGMFLNWTQRIQIALDVAAGLNYLHNFATSSHVHKDVKSSNILLDSDFRAKIANFGLTRSTQGHDGQYSLTKHVVGTIGYMAPEYLENGVVSTKLDVYAFGVLLLEMLTGKAVSVLYEENKHLSDLLSAVINDEEQVGLKNFMDPSMEEKYPSEFVIFVVRIIEGCLKKNPDARAPMDEIVQLLSRTLSNSLNWELSNSSVE
ncbi:lysM domain receptor-like kinase 4 [Humulus lupulus]|uniref:lysM domain receptor-like kinase 4 n=1 Tax=Humulus lupulus TaxID=3486 RepID=UPI002B40954D|nr:lysM domain receptor-like kinase 4 [Humulus lupulus]